MILEFSVNWSLFYYFYIIIFTLKLALYQIYQRSDSINR